MEGYIVSLIIFTCIFALFSLGLNLQWGLTGLINFGHVAFMAVGSYVVVILTLPGYLKEIPTQLLDEFNWMQETPWVAAGLQSLATILPQQIPLIGAVLIGACTAAGLGVLAGVATLKLRTDYLAIVTVGLSEILRSIALNEEWLTKGTFGIQRFPLPLSTLNPNVIMRMGMIVVLTIVLGLALWHQWQWAKRTMRSASAQALLRSSSLLLGYLGSLLGVVVMVGWGSQQLKASAAISNGVTGAFLIGAIALLIGLYRWVWLTWMSSLPALTEGTALITSITVTGLSLWLYGYGSSAIYHYDRNPTKTGLMWISVLLVALTFWALQRLSNSPWGRVLKAIREDETVATALGKNVFWYKLQSLMLGGAIAGMAGALYAWQLTTVYPDNFRPIETFNAWTIVVLGGAGSNVGTLIGAIIFWAYQTLTRFILGDVIPLNDAQIGAFRVMLIGLLLMGLMIWRPQGILGNKEELTLDR
ncbi:MAG: branched-chain amino acid ABC transporter permease [Cyanobacteria bacterium P01_E01_bin.6]